MWKLILNAAGWTAYQSEMVDALKVPPEAVVWGNGPTEYPCLAASIRGPSAGGRQRVTTAYVYVTDALHLCAAAGETPKTTAAGSSATQDQFNRWMTALALATVDVIRDTGIFGQAGDAGFEERLLRQLEFVDAVKSGKAIDDPPAYAAKFVDVLRPT